MMYDSYQAMADVGDAVRLLAFNAERILNVWAVGPFRLAVSADGRLLRSRGAGRLHA